jgi:hypothetical protein
MNEGVRSGMANSCNQCVAALRVARCACVQCRNNVLGSSGLLLGKVFNLFGWADGPSTEQQSWCPPASRRQE